jgi:hypothetical protein
VEDDDLMVMLAFADERGDLRPLAQLLRAGVELPDWVRNELADLFDARRLQPRRVDLWRDNKAARDAFFGAVTLQVRGLYRDAKQQPGETSKQRLARVVHAYAEGNKLGPRLEKRLTTAVTNLLGGRGRLARSVAKSRQ